MAPLTPALNGRVHEEWIAFRLPGQTLEAFGEPLRLAGAGTIEAGEGLCCRRRNMFASRSKVAILCSATVVFAVLAGAGAARYAEGDAFAFYKAQRAAGSEAAPQPVAEANAPETLVAASGVLDGAPAVSAPTPRGMAPVTVSGLAAPSLGGLPERESVSAQGGGNRAGLVDAGIAMRGDGGLDDEADDMLGDDDADEEPRFIGHRRAAEDWRFQPPADLADPNDDETESAPPAKYAR